MNLAETQRWANAFLDERTPTPARDEPTAAAPGLERAAAAPPPTSEPSVGFSPFIPAHAIRARDLSGELIAAAERARAEDGVDAGFAAARARADELLTDHDPALVRFALKLFMTHDAEGQRLQIPALEERAPLKVVPSGPPAPLAAIGAEATGMQEAALNWWREDPELNEHHDHWHAVYPTAGLADPRPGDPRHTRLQDRQGELFMYMHEQMLARYDHERIALGLGPVAPLDDYAAPVSEGYDPTAGLAGWPASIWTDDEQPKARPDGAHMPASVRLSPTDTVRRTELQTWHGALQQAATTGHMASMAPGHQLSTTIDALGHAVEPSAAPTDPPQRPTTPDPDVYQWLHGAGHVFLSLAAGAPQGVMADTDTAVRDPVFYRWHRHIDDLAHAWQETQAPHDLTANAAAVELRHGARPAPERPAESGDLLLFDEAEIGADLDDAAFAAAVEQSAGGVHWDDDLAATHPATSELQTEMLWRTLKIEPPIPGTPQVRIPYLDQRPFAYALRLRNTDPAGAAHDVTIRLFFVADALFEERRNWIELDKFRFHVSRERTVAVRRARESSVIRKPASKPPGPTEHSPPPPDRGEPPPGWDAESYCDCGWPYNLLIPRGTGQGMRCWLAAVVTDWEQDQVTGSTCGSMSYCGAKDRYPDQRPMGYPFDRPITGPQIADVLSTLPSAAARSFTIRWLNPTFPT